MSQDGVVDASVWLAKGSLRAHVKVARSVRLEAHDLESLCVASVGPEHTPSEFVLESSGV